MTSYVSSGSLGTCTKLALGSYGNNVKLSESNNCVNKISFDNFGDSCPTLHCVDIIGIVLYVSFTHGIVPCGQEA